MRPSRTASQKDKLLFHLKTKGPQTAAQLARRAGVTPVAIRQHLARLEDEGLVAYEDRAGQVGRPRRVWHLAERAEDRFPDGHGLLATTLLTAAQQAFGQDGLARLIDERAGVQAAAYRDRMPARSAPLRDKVAALTAIRREEGYLAEWKKEKDGGFLLIENHCPVCEAARECVSLCSGELALFRRLLGPRVTVEREEYILDGDRRCTYSITPRSK
jgi:predicted ArsR family transcriptional regulator